MLPQYDAYSGALAPALTAPRSVVIAGLRDIVQVEGPILGYRLHMAYVLASGGQRVGKQIGRSINAAINEALRTGVLVDDNPLGHAGLKPRTYRLPGQPNVLVRELGPRLLGQVPPTELASLLEESAVRLGWDSPDLLFRDVLQRLGRNRLTGPAAETLQAALSLTGAGAADG
jgi:hypothetical protein